MSTSNLYRVFKTKAKEIAEYRNGHGTAPVIWGFLCVKYLHTDYHSWGLGVSTDKLWALAVDTSVPRHLRLCLAFTLDNAICPPEKVVDLADALDKTHAETILLKPEYVNHWAAVAADLRKVDRVPKTLGYGLTCTSVSDVWHDYTYMRGVGKPLFDLVAYVDGAPA